MAVAVGESIGVYKVLGKLGAGGMGEVYRALDTTLDREVALKVLSAEFQAQPEALNRFEQEARLASALNHPNIVTVYGVGRHGAVVYIAMELVTGATVAEMLRLPPQTLESSLGIAVQIANGLAKAHDAAIIHRDLKPQNIMVNQDGVAKILDFGLGKLVTPLGDLSTVMTGRHAFETRPNMILGTVGYMSPEQAGGKPLDFRSDQFSFGVLLYEMLTGRQPFTRETAFQTLSAIVGEEPPPASSVNPQIVSELDQIIRQCLRKNPEDRFSSTRELAQALRQVHEDLKTGSLRLYPQLRRWMGSRSVKLAAVGCLLILLAAAIGAVWRFRTIPPVIPQDQRVAILSLTDVDGDPSDQAFVDGVMDTLTGKLSQIEQFRSSFRVIPAATVRLQNVTSPHAAKQTFGATTVIDGTAHRTGDSFKLTLDVIDPQEMKQLRSLAVDLPSSDVSRFEDRLFQQVAEALGLVLTSADRNALAAGATTIAAAYDSYIRGRGYLAHYQKNENLDNALKAFSEAVSDDPGYALAYAGICETYWDRFYNTKETSWVKPAQTNCEKARTITDSLAPIHITLALLDNGTGNYEGAVGEAQRALELDPANAVAYLELARAWQHLGKNDQAEVTFKRAIAARPGDAEVHNALGAFYYTIGRFGDAAAEFRETVRLTPESYRAYSNLGGTYYQIHRYDDATETLQKSLDLQPNVTAYANLGAINYGFQRYAEAAQMLENAVKLSPANSSLWRNLAEADRWIPDSNKAADAYRKAIETGEQQFKINPLDVNVLKTLGESYLMMGDKKKGMALLNQAVQAAPADVNVMSTMAGIYEYLKDRPHALSWIEKAIRGGLPIERVENDPNLTALRADPRFQTFREH